MKKAAIMALCALLLVPAFVDSAYSHGVTCGLSCVLGGQPIAPQADNEILRFFSGIQGFVLAAIMAGVTVFGALVIWKNRPRKVAC